MSLSIVKSRAEIGIKAPLVTVEVHLSNGLPAMSMVGLAEAAVKESKDRVRSAIMNSRFEFPVQRITINLAPADLPKEGGRFDLAIAIGILAASKQIPNEFLDHYEFAGELALTGAVRPIRGTLPFAIATYQNKRALIISHENAAEAKLIKLLEVLPAYSLIEVCSHLCGQKKLEPADSTPLEVRDHKDYPDLKDVHGQSQAKRALEIAAAGGLSLLFIGPPGTGKSMLAHRLPGIMPHMTEIESLESAAIQSIARTPSIHTPELMARPFRSPHHSASSVALVGGGSPPRPGEISLAHHGVLFLDELPEFEKRVLEALREPLETGSIIISRAARQAEFPAQFQLMAAMNPCPCGYYGDPTRNCRCTQEQVVRYRNRLSGPFLDRIDMHVEVPRLQHQFLIDKNKGSNPETSATVRARVQKARELQWQRQNCTNAKLTGESLKEVCQLNAAEQVFLEQAMQRLQLSARAYHRILRTGRTIADLAGADRIATNHLSEALQYRVLDRT